MALDFATLMCRLILSSGLAGKSNTPLLAIRCLLSEYPKTLGPLVFSGPFFYLAEISQLPPLRFLPDSLVVGSAGTNGFMAVQPFTGKPVSPALERFL